MEKAKKAKYILKTGVALLKTKNTIPIIHPKDTQHILENKVALITGGSGGIGYAIAKSFAESGSKVIITGTNQKKLEENCEKIGENSKYIILNLLDTDNLNLKIQEISKIFGRIDILVNSAGVHSTKTFNDFLNVDEKEYDLIMNINLKGTYFVSQAVANYMIKNEIKGHILNISSSVSKEPAWSPYRLSKCALNGLTRGMADKLLPYNIIVNGIAPGSTATQLLGFNEGDSIYTADNKVGRYILPDEIATYAKLMVSELGDMIIGDTLFIAGGRGTIDIR